MEDYEYFRVLEDGNREQISSFEKKSDNVYVVVDHKARVITLWKGLSAGVRLKFIGSRVSGDVRKDVGFHYKTEVCDEDDESASFKQRIFGLEHEETASVVETEQYDGPSESLAARAAREGITVSDEEIESIRTGPGTGKMSKMGGIGQRPQASFLATPEFFSDKENKETVRQVKTAMQESDKEAARKILSELGSPKGWSREMVVIGNEVYRVSGDDADVSFENLDNPLDGIIMVKEYTPRLVCENGVVKAIELLKLTSEEVEVEEEFTQELADLTAMFQIEIE